jgi:hypothetical protein
MFSHMTAGPKQECGSSTIKQDKDDAKHSQDGSCYHLCIHFFLKSNDQPERRELVSRTLKVLVGISILWF